MRGKVSQLNCVLTKLFGQQKLYTGEKRRKLASPVFWNILVQAEENKHNLIPQALGHSGSKSVFYCTATILQVLMVLLQWNQEQTRALSLHLFFFHKESYCFCQQRRPLQGCRYPTNSPFPQVGRSMEPNPTNSSNFREWKHTPCQGASFSMLLATRTTASIPNIRQGCHQEEAAIGPEWGW